MTSQWVVPVEPPSAPARSPVRIALWAADGRRQASDLQPTELLPNMIRSPVASCTAFSTQVRDLFSIMDLQLLKRSTAVPDDADHPARRWFRRWSLWPPVLELPPWIRWVRASPAHPNRRVAGALIAAAAPLKPWIDLTPSFPTHVISRRSPGTHWPPRPVRA